MSQLRRVKTNQPGQTGSPNEEVTVQMTLRYSVVRFSIPDIVIPRGAAARDVISAWWSLVDRNQVKDPNIVCLSRDPDMYEIQNEAGEGYIEIEDGMEIFLKPMNKTSREVMTIDVTWDGFDKDGLPLRLSISPSVHREAPRSRLLELWLEFYKTSPTDGEVASHMFTDENEYYWKDHTGAEATPPWTPGQQVVLKMKPWVKDNTAERQRKRPRPPPADGRDPLRPSLGPLGSGSPGISTGASVSGSDLSSQPTGGSHDPMNQYVPLRRMCPTRQVTIRVIVYEQTIELKVNPKIILKELLHKVPQTISRDLPGWWHACVVDGKGDNQTYQEGYTIMLYAASEESIRRVNEPRTPKGSVALIPKAIGGTPDPKKKKELKEKRDWIWELCERGEIPIKDAGQFFNQIDTNKMVTMTTDGGANPNPGPAGWGVLIRQNNKFLCLWKHYPRASNNVMEISAVIAGLNYLPAHMVIWLSTDSQYVQKGVNEWMPKWKRNGWRNSKKAGIANKSLWLGLDAAIARHERVEFTRVKAHSGLIHNEIADTLATRGVKGKSYCPVTWFDQLPADTETEDDLSILQTEVITQTDEFGADEDSGKILWI
jgi:ribonuclease HI